MFAKGKESVEQTVRFSGRQALAAAQRLATASTEEKNKVLESLADLIESRSRDLMEINRKDLVAIQGHNFSSDITDAIKLTPGILKKLVESIRSTIEQNDPVGFSSPYATQPYGLMIEKVRVPLGVIGVVFENSPTCAITAAALCIKSGNACILFGDDCAIHTNLAFADIFEQALKKTHIPPRAVQLIPSSEKQALDVLLKMDDFVKCILPMCNDEMLQYITNSRTNIPVIREYKGICNMYVDAEADPEKVKAILINAKCKDPHACSSVENLFIHQKIAPQLLPELARIMVNESVELRIDSAAEGILLGEENVPLNPLSEDDLREEFQALILAVKVVVSTESAIDEINTYGSGLADVIITENKATAQKFFSGVNSATVYCNASPLFTDGQTFEIGSDIAISTDRMHIRGPITLNELCTHKYIILGSGQTK
ncbi:MAG: glutamate-5-semialdehyde dehydrogenase [Verrucomicrobia bacterium GWF2_51_19]|nr:MAG: glutamate-5-semialdehyde dehydrogenase [Verrucomicrobia bacterium GWF2_51_19]